MKKILITGKGSYIGTSFIEYMNQFPKDYQVEELDMISDAWKESDFSKYDVVFHVAGLAHSTPNESQRELYYRVNTDLTYEIALKAKQAGVSQFIFMSSIIVYGSGKVGKDRIITKHTPLQPDNFYGDSKKQAEFKIKPLEDEKFRIVVLRPPMIYGPGSKGNYPRLVSLAKKVPIFPNIKNQRSMLYIDNLSVFVKLVIDNCEHGIYHPQNDEYVCTTKLVKEVATIYNHRIWVTSLFNPFIRLLNKQVQINKMFGNMVIDKELSYYGENYSNYSFKQSVIETEGQVK